MQWLVRDGCLSEPVFFVQVLPRHRLLTNKAADSSRKDNQASGGRVRRYWNRGHVDAGHADSQAHSFTLLGEHKRRNGFSPEDEHGGVVLRIAEYFSGLVNRWSWRNLWTPWSSHISEAALHVRDDTPSAHHHFGPDPLRHATYLCDPADGFRRNRPNIKMCSRGSKRSLPQRLPSGRRKGGQQHSCIKLRHTPASAHLV